MQHPPVNAIKILGVEVTHHYPAYDGGLPTFSLLFVFLGWLFLGLIIYEKDSQEIFRSMSIFHVQLFQDYSLRQSSLQVSYACQHSLAWYLLKAQ